MLKLINQEFNVNTDNAKIISNGWDFIIVEIDGTLFRYPRQKHYYSLFRQEIGLMNHLHNKITIDIPYYHLVSQNSNCPIGAYQKIPGSILTKKVYQLMNEEERDQFAQDISLFLLELHSSITLEEALELHLPIYQPSLDLKVPEKYQGLWEEFLVMYKSQLSNKSPLSKKTLVHNDFHNDNILLSNNKLSGVIDFTEACIGDRVLDIKKLFLTSPDLVERVVEYYDPGNKDKLVLEAAIHFLHSRFIYLDELPDKVDEIEGHINDFLPYWRKLIKN